MGAAIRIRTLMRRQPRTAQQCERLWVESEN
jgi:hypothetical protein